MNPSKEWLASMLPSSWSEAMKQYTMSGIAAPWHSLHIVFDLGRRWERAVQENKRAEGSNEHQD